jgi:uncharacterized protein (TIGR03546 family)
VTFLIKQLISLVRLLNSETGTNQIATGVAAGFILGFAPALSLQGILVFSMLFVFRIQAGAAFLAAFFFSFIAWMLDPVCHALGIAVLEIDSLQSLYTSLYNMPIVPLTRFYNSIVMGSGILSFLLAPFVFLLARKLVWKYRDAVLARIRGTKVFKAMQATVIYQWYMKYDQLY